MFWLFVSETIGIDPISEMNDLYPRASKVNIGIIGDEIKQNVMQSTLIFLLFLRIAQTIKPPNKTHARIPSLTMSVDVLSTMGFTKRDMFAIKATPTVAMKAISKTLLVNFLPLMYNRMKQRKKTVPTKVMQKRRENVSDRVQ